MSHKSLSLRFQLISFILLPLSALVLIGSLVAIHTLTQIEEKKLQEEVEIIARAIQEPLEQSLSRDRLDQAEETLNSILQFRRIYSASLYDRTGRLILSRGADAPASPDLDLVELDSTQEHAGEYERLQRRRVYSHFVLLSGKGGRNLGVLQVSRRRSEIEEALGGLQSQAIQFVALISVLIGLIILFAHHYFIGRPLNALGRSISRISMGEIEHRAPLVGPEELVSVTQDFNSMMDHLVSTQKKLAEKEVETSQLEDQLKTKEKLAAIGRLAGGVAHELGTPMSIVDGIAQQRLRKNSGLSSDDRQSYEDIRVEIKRMERIVRDLLDFSKQAPMVEKPSNLVEILEASRRMIIQSFQDKTPQIELETSADHIPVHCDPSKAEQVFVNLIKNAVQANPEGVVRIRVQEDLSEAQTKVSIEDEGQGIPPHMQDKIFEPFFTTKPIGSGTGLGLAVVHGLVEEMKADVRVENRKEGGARFEVSLPRQKG